MTVCIVSLAAGSASDSRAAVGGYNSLWEDARPTPWTVEATAPALTPVPQDVTPDATQAAPAPANVEEAAAAGGPIGPADAPPGGATITPNDPTGRQVGLAGGIDYVVTGLDPTRYEKLYWGIVQPGAVQHSEDGAIDEAGETLSYFGSVMDGLTSKATWSGETSLLYWNGYSPADMNLSTRMTLTISDLDGNPLPLLSPYDLGISGSGVLVEVSGPFKYNLIIESFASGSASYLPALQFFNDLHTDPAMDGRVQTNITGGYYYTDVAITNLAATNDSPALVGSPVALTASLSSGTNVVYTWDFGDGESGTDATTTHSYANGGTYTAVVTATNGAGTQTAETTVKVNYPPVFLPFITR